MLSQKENSGFTLIEVMIVVVIIALMAAIGAPTISTLMPDMYLKDAARTLYTNMQQAKIQAVKNNRNTAISFNTGANNYTVCDEWDGAAAICIGATRTVQFITVVTDKDYKSGVGYGYGSATLQANAAADAFPMATDDSVSYTAPDNVVVFTPQGMGNPGYVYLDHVNNTTTYAVGNSSSGMIKLLKWVGGIWQ